MNKIFNLCLQKGYFKKNKYIIPVSIFLVALILRFYRFESWFEWSGNQSLYSWELRQLTQGHFTLVGFDAAAIGGLRFPPFQLYMLAPLFLISAGNPLSINAFLIILGAVTTITFYFIGSKIFGQRVAVISAIVYAFSLNAVTIDRKFNGSTFMIIITLLVIGQLYKIINSKKAKFSDFIILGTLIGLGFSMHYQSIFLLIGTIIILIWQKKLKFVSGHFLSFILAVAFWLSPLLIFDIRHNFFNLKGIFLLQGSYAYHGLSLVGIAQSAQYILGNFFGLIYKPAYFFDFQNFLKLPFLLLITIAVIFLPFLFKSKRKSDVVLHLFIFLSFLGFLTFSFYRRGTYNFDYYYWYLIPGFVFAIAKAFDKLFEFKLSFLGIFLILLFVGVNLKLFSSYKAPDSYKTFYDAVGAILVDAKNQKSEKIVVKFGQIHPGQTDYLFYLQSKKYTIAPENIILIADQDLFLDRTLKITPPIVILSQSESSDKSADYLFEKSFERKEDLFLIFESGKYKVYKLI